MKAPASGPGKGWARPPMSSASTAATWRGSRAGIDTWWIILAGSLLSCLSAGACPLRGIQSSHVAPVGQCRRRTRPPKRRRARDGALVNARLHCYLARMKGAPTGRQAGEGRAMISLDEDYIGTDANTIIVRALKVCGGVLCRLSNGNLLGAHYTNGSSPLEILTGCTYLRNHYMGGATVASMYVVARLAAWQQRQDK